jgi:hypothetical protein
MSTPTSRPPVPPHSPPGAGAPATGPGVDPRLPPDLGEGASAFRNTAISILRGWRSFGSQWRCFGGYRRNPPTCRYLRVPRRMGPILSERPGIACPPGAPPWANRVSGSRGMGQAHPPPHHTLQGQRGVQGHHVSMLHPGLEVATPGWWPCALCPATLLRGKGIAGCTETGRNVCYQTLPPRAPAGASHPCPGGRERSEAGHPHPRSPEVFFPSLEKPLDKPSPRCDTPLAPWRHTGPSGPAGTATPHLPRRVGPRQPQGTGRRARRGGGDTRRRDDDGPAVWTARR